MTQGYPELQPQPVVETEPYPPDGVVAVDDVGAEAVATGALEVSVPAPAAGRDGDVTSMYDAPAEPGDASTATAERHFAAS
jgi:hypothetical protein